MFFDTELMSRSMVGAAWRAAHHVAGGEQPARLTNLCKRVHTRLKHTGQHGVSVRAAAVLVDGVARLHAQQADELLRDVSTFTLRMGLNNPRYANDDTDDTDDTDGTDGTDDTDDSASDEDAASSHGVVDVGGHGDDSWPRYSPGTRRSADVQKAICGGVAACAREFVSYGTWQKLQEQRQQRHVPRDKIRNVAFNLYWNTNTYTWWCGVGGGGLQRNMLQGGAGDTADTGMQTDDFESSLPFAEVFIFDKYESRVPSRMLLSSVNPAARQL